MQRRVRFFLVLLGLAFPLTLVQADDETAAKWVKRLGGQTTGKPITAIDLRGTLANDEGLKNLADLKSLESLDLSSTLVTDDGMKEIGKIQSLQKLTLKGTPITEAGWKELKGLKKLHTLILNPAQINDKTMSGLQEAGLLHALINAQGAEEKNADDAKDASQIVRKRPASPDEVLVMDLRFTGVTDAGVRELNNFKNLHTLMLGTSQITNDMLKALKETEILHVLSRAEATDGKRATKADEVASLDLRFTPVTDVAIKELAPLKNLQELSLAGTAFGDEGLKEIVNFTKLQSLNLGDTKVTDDGLNELAKCKNLQFLYLYRAPVTGPVVNKLQSSIPDCRILR